MRLTKNGGPKSESMVDMAYSKSFLWFLDRVSRYDELDRCTRVLDTGIRASKTL